MDLDQIEALLKLLHEHDVNDFKYQDDELSMRFRLGAPPVIHTAPAPAPVVAAPAAPPPAAAPAPAASAAAADDGSMVIDSPMVGTFYRSPNPDSEPFVTVGQRVDVGQTLCIIEAMKLMNEIEAEVAGTVAAIMVENAEPVQFGQAIFKIRPT